MPVKAGLNTMDSVSESVLPEPIADDPAPLMVHWLLDSVPELPGVRGPVTLVPALLKRYIPLLPDE